MQKKSAPIPKTTKPSPQAVRRAVASSTALETGQSLQQLERKLHDRSQQRFAHVRLAD